MQDQLVLAPAKLNLTLAVLGRRQDGYHELESVMVPLHLADQLWLRPTEDISVSVDYPGVPPGSDNLAHRAAVALRSAAGVTAGARIHIEKHIPPAAGLGGESADAAAALRGLNELWQLEWPLRRLADLGRTLGADVPFCLLNRPALVQGIGERITPLPPLPALHVVLAMPRVTWPGPKTRTVFAAYRPGGPQPDTAAMLAAVRAGRPGQIAAALGNALEPAVTALHPVVAALKEQMLAAGAAGVAMTGAGPTVFAICRDRAAALGVAGAVGSAAAWTAMTITAGGEAP